MTRTITMTKYGEPLALPSGLITAFQDGRVALFLGAGVSMPAGAPGWETLIRPLRESLKDHYARVESLDLPQVVSLAWAHDGDHALRSHLSDELELSRDLAVHEQLISLPTKIILTTNYDPCLGRAAAEARTPYKVIAKDEDVPSFGRSSLKIVHLYGSADSPLATEEDLITFTRQQPGLAMLLQYTLATRTVLFIGFSFRDYNVLNHLLMAQAITGGTDAAQPHYAFMMMGEEEDAIIALWRRRKLEIFGYCDVPSERMSDVLVGFVEQLANSVYQKTQGIKREELAAREEERYFQVSDQDHPPVMRRESTFSVLAIPDDPGKSGLSPEGHKRGLARKALYGKWIKKGFLHLILNATEQYARDVRGYSDEMRFTRLSELKTVIQLYLDNPNLELVIRRRPLPPGHNVSYATLGHTVLFESEPSSNPAKGDPFKASSVDRDSEAIEVFNNLFDREMYALMIEAQKELASAGIEETDRRRAGKLVALREIDEQLARLAPSRP